MEQSLKEKLTKMGELSKKAKKDFVTLSTKDKNKILDIIEEISEDDSFREDLDADLLDLGILDSLGMVTLIIALEKNFSIKLPITEINVEDVNTPNKIIKLVEGKVNNG